MRARLRSYGIITAGSVVFGLAFDLFFVSNQVAIGGVTGLAQVVNALFPQLGVGLMTIVLNVPLFLAGWRLLGVHLLVSSLFSMVVSSLVIDGVNLLCRFAPMDPMLAAVCGGAMMGVGYGMVFSQGATTGGTDIVARLLKRKLPWLPMGELVLAADVVVLVLAVLAFGQVEAALYGGISLFVSAKVTDLVLYGLDTSKIAYIVSEQWRAVADTLLREQERGVTILNGKGAYTGDARPVLLVAFKQREIVQIKRAVYAIDPQAFLIVCDARDVLGEGFGDYQKEEI